MCDRGFSSRRSNGAVWRLEKSAYVGADVASDGGEFLWTAVEEVAAEVLRTAQPTVSSERRRGSVISYVQRLLGCCLGCQVFPYGSVPLKTYLPDGDIDLTVLTNPSVEDAFISDIFDVLKQEELNEYAEFEVKDVQLISAEVKLVKCLIQDIIVDISCNQLGGLCTLSFLEQIDRLVDKDHLFKRSIILIKAWCYYESRILGATHGLFSTYALEILVLYIFHIYHSSLKGPSSVLYRFLDYFSKFDWDNYCVSLNGPVCKSSFPDIVVHTPVVSRYSLLLSKQFLTNSTSMFKVPSRDPGKQSRPFQLKFINIIDPLKDDNNLGRSVNQGNFYRIRSALKFGARKLGEILSLPSEVTRKELKKFFASTLARHGGRLQASSQPSDSSSISSFHSSDVDSSTGVRSPGAETEGTSDSSSQGSDSSSYHVDRPIQPSHLFEIPLEAAKRAENLSCNILQNSQNAIEVVAGKCGGAEGPKMCGDINREPVENTAIASNLVLRSNRCIKANYVASRPKPSTARVLSGNQSWKPSDRNERSEPLDQFSDLTGDYESHLKSLLFGQSFHGTATVLPTFYNLTAWDVYRQTNFGQDHYFQINPNHHAMWGQQFRQVRGTGTYIPRTDLGSWRGGKHPVRKGRKGSPTYQSYNNYRKFDPGMIPIQGNVTQQLYNPTELLKSKRSTVHPSSFNATGLQCEGFELSSFENLPGDKHGADEKASDDSLELDPNPKAPDLLIPDKKCADTEETVDRVAGQAYQLKDEDFPPLASKIQIRRSASA